jgi:RNA-binding protein 8A
MQGYAMVEYKTQDEAAAAIEALHGTDFMGQALSVGWAFVRPPRANRGGFRRR